MPSEIVIHQPDPPALVAELSPLAIEAQRFAVDSIAANATALERAQRLRRGEKAITEYFEPSRKAADEAKKRILEARDGLIRPLAAARLVYDGKAQEWEGAQRRIAEAESARLAIVARAAEEERQIEAAIQAEAEGQDAEAEAILDEPVMAPIVTVAPAVAQVEGVGARRNWTAKLRTPGMFIQWLAAHPEETAMIERAADACQPEANARARSQRGAMNLPGWEAVEETVRSYR